MSLEQFKTQVLLLHSEQSTLDSLSSGFNDRYTVHCATSGTEALNTLGEIQIDVIISAHELPGMSGLDALREAKKRSPDTIGILLAGNADEGLEALVGDQEVFEIVRGSVTADSLKELIDNATRQARLIALAESANDTTASPDEPPVTEHIVMETSENGSTIISDGTGQFPGLNPAKISAAADVGARSVDVLVLTQDEEFLETVKESARGLHNIIYANTVSQADEAIRKNKIGVAVVDAALVGTNVEKLTMHLRSSAPRLVAIVAGRRDDGEMLMDLINRGKVYRFLLKPVSPGRARLAIEASVKHHLEAPDSAFKVSGEPAAAPQTMQKPAPRPEPEPKPRPAAKAEPAPQPKPKAKPKAKAKKAKAVPAPKPAPDAKPAPQPAKEKDAGIVAKPEAALSPIDDGLGDAFDDSSFTETMTGIVETVTKSFKPKKKKKEETPSVPAAPGTAMDSAMDIAPAAAASSGSLFSDPKVLGIGAAALVVVAAVSFFVFGGSDEPAAVEPAVVDTAGQQAADSGPAAEEQAPSIFETEVIVPETLGIEDLLDEAQAAVAAGNVFAPVGNNAIDLYLEALDVAPGDPAATEGLQNAIDETLAMAENALLERRADDAVTALQGLEYADPGNARLPFLKAQLSQVQLRNYIDGARAAIREQRFEDAQIAIDGAWSLGVDDTTEINAVATELSDALSSQQVEQVLAQANARLDTGDLVTPTNDNARYYFELALARDPGNVAARQGLVVIASKLALQARDQIDAGNFDAADNLLAGAQRIDPSSAELAAATSALATARERREQEIRAAADRAAAERAAAQRAAAERAAAERAAAERAAAEKAAAEAAAAERLSVESAASTTPGTAQGPAPIPQQAVEQASRQALEPSSPQQVVEQSTDQAPGESASIARVQPPVAQPPVPQRSIPQQAVQQQPAFANNAVAGAGDAIETQAGSQPQAAAASPVAVSTLKRTKYVAPKYPRSAQRRELSGWVDVLFTVDIDGTVTNIVIRDSNPGDTFVNAAVNSVEKWEFEPVIENGVAVQKRAAVRMMFAFE